jgi:hypothetical protein
VSDDLHQRFERWLLAGASGEPPRDLALHASLCAECLGRVSAFDLLTNIDAGRAPLPPSRLAERSRPPLLRLARGVGALAGVALVAAVVGIGLGSILELRSTQAGAEPGDGAQSEAPAQGVLGATGGPSADETGGAPSAAPTAEPTSQVTPVGAPTAHPVNPLPPTTRPASAAPTPAPSSDSAAPTPSPSATAAVTPTPVATPTPTPDVTPTPTPTPEVTPTPTPEPTATPIP